LLSAPLLTSPPFISKQKELGGYNGTVMPFVQGVLFGMHLVFSQETQVLCR
jgi:hypothetical protein